ncbi:copper resistance protein NlpE [Chryseobacterium sp. JUb7]|uniref:copper resistance protein NlpE n=1 Tax=Chryseobacterium sp. JUb7 TaxID=2940599 RepID=UPI00216A9615|nr:copper resistance protein NlpE [Chryseobacterium sp. JUb7]MCS3529728.1 putative lipoprotein NlpE involved in copper resistance [Chryseobacterium sp. JUb7]
MKHQIQILGILGIAFLASCSPKEKPQEVNPKTDPMAIQTPMDTTKTDTAATAHNSANSLDWNGTYEAVVPCADCPGIKTVLTLNKDKTFTISEEYLERKSKNEDKGNFEWDASGSVITLNGKSAKYKYKVGENSLTQLDMSGQPIDGPNKDLYVFKKK